ncbi:Vesicular inhibitory amino acid transporter [Trichostrongylus colubriformis]|uniref:Vesicular inhibitory amino acid transporter n=1 Tax=Trichostrongylus colubriformis TaxID=6319 RepID=A0AAN8FSN5_TRICO
MSQRLQTLQDWSNKHVFTASLDYWNQDPPETESYSMRPKRPAPPANYGTVEEGPEGESESPVEVDNIVEDPHAGGEPITALQAAWNVTNAIQGMFIVGLPIAVKVGGWWSVFAMMGVAYICYWTGILLIECLYEKDKKVRFSYREVAEFYRPGFGKWVLAAQLTELLSTCIIYLVLAADLLQSCFPSIDKPAWMMLVAAALLACAFLDSLVVVSQLSFANAISHLIVNAIMMIYCLTEIRSWSLSSVTFGLDINTLPTMIGVVVFGYTSHIFLPSLEGNMKNPKEFSWMLKWSHVAAALFKAIFGLCGYLTFGELTQPEISNSLPNQGFKVVVNLVLVVKALLSYPLPFYAAVQLLKDNLFRGTKTTPFTGCYSPDGSLREWALFLRILLLLFTLFIALSVPYLIELMGLIGNITGTMLSFIWPALFHLHIRGDKMVNRDRRFDQMIIGLGCSICISGVYFSFMELLRAIRANDQ